MRVFRLRTACRPPFSFRSPDGHEDQSARRFGRTVARAFDPPSGHGSRRWAAWPIRASVENGRSPLHRSAAPLHGAIACGADRLARRSEEHTSELQSLMRISYAVFCLKKKKTQNQESPDNTTNQMNK